MSSADATNSAIRHEICLEASLAEGLDTLKLVDVSLQVFLCLHRPGDQTEVHSHAHHTGGSQSRPQVGHLQQQQSELTILGQDILKKNTKQLASTCHTHALALLPVKGCPV